MRTVLRLRQSPDCGFELLSLNWLNVDIEFYKAFEDRHRGTRDSIKQRLEVYLPWINALKKIHEGVNAVDLGCGRGEWLELLSAHSIAARGIDIDPVMAEYCKSLDLDAVTGDAITALQQMQDDSVSILTAFHVVEHLDFDILMQLVREAHRVLKPGGLLITETPNPENISVATQEFYIDPTHRNPVPIPLLEFVINYSGIRKTKVMRLQEREQLEQMKAVTLNDVLHGSSRDYAILAQKESISECDHQFEMLWNNVYGISLHEISLHYDQQQAGLHRAHEMQIAELAKHLHEANEIIFMQKNQIDDLRNGLAASNMKIDAIKNGNNNNTPSKNKSFLRRLIKIDFVNSTRDIKTGAQKSAKFVAQKLILQIQKRQNFHLSLMKAINRLGLHSFAKRIYYKIFSNPMQTSILGSDLSETEIKILNLIDNNQKQQKNERFN